MFIESKNHFEKGENKMKKHLISFLAILLVSAAAGVLTVLCRNSHTQAFAKYILERLGVAEVLNEHKALAGSKELIATLCG